MRDLNGYAMPIEFTVRELQLLAEILERAPERPGRDLQNLRTKVANAVAFYSLGLGPDTAREKLISLQRLLLGLAKKEFASWQECAAAMLTEAEALVGFLDQSARGREP